MTSQDVKNALPTNLFGDGPVGETIILRRDPQGEMVMPLDAFVSRFSTADMVYASLVAHEKATAGWPEVFAAWREAGYIM